MERSSMTTVEGNSFLYDLRDIKIELRNFACECGLRNLVDSEKWLTELNYSLDPDVADEELPEMEIDAEGYETYLMASALFPVREYARSSYFVRSVNTARAKFLNFLCMYKMLEQNKPMDFTDMNTTTKCDYYSCLKKLSETLNEHLEEFDNDGFTYYLKGLVSLNLGSTSSAVDSFCKAVNYLPLLWEAWNELSKLIDDKAMLARLNLPTHWMKEFFLGQTYAKIQRNDDAFSVLCSLYDNGFSKSHFVLSRIAAVYHNRRDVNNALNLFKQMQTEDPFRIEDLDTYSNLLYVSDMKKELAYLAHYVFYSNRFTAEACCVVGNYFSTRGDHVKSAAYFQRAVKLNSNFMSALILRGHEFMEMKNTRGAITSYRDAIAMNPQDYRAWYGLGQTYEILRLPFYSLNYHKRAQLIRPDDSRMLIAMGEVYEKLNRYDEALRCYKRARNVGDVDSFALSRLARLYTEMDDEEEAASAYKLLVKETEGTQFSKEYADAYKYLAYHHLKLCQFHLAFQFAQLCLNFEETKEEGKALLKEIATRRDMEGNKTFDGEMEDSSLKMNKITRHIVPTSSFPLENGNLFS